MADWPKVNPEKLLTLVSDAYDGRLVLPEFQRSFVWSRQQVEDLLESVLQGYFIGNFLALEAYGSSRPFPPKLVEGVQELHLSVDVKTVSVKRYVLDGQQRITAIFYALYAPPIPLKGSKNPYKFFVNVEKLLASGPSDAIEGISTRDMRELTRAEKYAAEGRYLPFTFLKDNLKVMEWLWSEQTYLKTRENKNKLQQYITRVYDYPVPVISIDENIGIEAIVDTFEKINRTGTRLSTFDLLVARLYPDVKLRDLWESFEDDASVKLGLKPGDFVEVLEPEYLLKVISLVLGRSCKRAALLELSHKDVEEHWDRATEHVINAMKRLRESYGVRDFKRHVPYLAMLPALCALLIRIDDLGKSKALYDKLDQWYWAAVFSQRYESSADTYASTDYTDISKWFSGERMPEWFEQVSARLVPETLDVSDTRSAVYRGVMCLIVLRGAKDFWTGQTPSLDIYEEDHIFPKSKYKGNASVNSVLNRTLIAKTTNSLGKKGARKPSDYLRIFAENLLNENALKDILNTHLIEDQAYQAMNNDNLAEFVKERQNTVYEEIISRLPRRKNS
ncbi:MAG: DUF262 domain-containing protein [Chloroflexi bacterium]|nr:DUF262 domain-containing protein [Chloroflexota bacterium]